MAKDRFFAARNKEISARAAKRLAASIRTRAPIPLWAKMPPTPEHLILATSLQHFQPTAQLAAISVRSQSFRRQMKPWKLASAQRMRANPTPSEAALRRILHRDKFPFLVRSQSLMLGYIADFYIAKHRLVIEADGGYHVTRRPYDERRDKALALRGFSTLRIPSGICSMGNTLQIRSVVCEAVRLIEQLRAQNNGRRADQCNDVRPERETVRDGISLR